MSRDRTPMDSTIRTRIVVVGDRPPARSRRQGRRLDEHADVTILQKAPDLSMASCGYPYYVGGVFDDATCC